MNFTSLCINPKIIMRYPKSKPNIKKTSSWSGSLAVLHKWLGLGYNLLERSFIFFQSFLKAHAGLVGNSTGGDIVSHDFKPFPFNNPPCWLVFILSNTGLFCFSLGYLIRCVLIMAQSSVSASLYRSYSRIDVMITAGPLGGKQHPPRITGQRGFGQRKIPE